MKMKNGGGEKEDRSITEKVNLFKVTLLHMYRINAMKPPSKY
jgi:hypothetical protein